MTDELKPIFILLLRVNVLILIKNKKIEYI